MRKFFSTAIESEDMRESIFCLAHKENRYQTAFSVSFFPIKYVGIKLDLDVAFDDWACLDFKIIVAK